MARGKLALTCALGTLACTLGLSSTAHAYERQWHAGGGIGLGGVQGGIASGMGPAAELHLSYGLTDQFNAMVEFGWASQSFAQPQVALSDETSKLLAVDGATTLTGLAGIAYTLDVLSWVPYGGVFGGMRMVGFRHSQGPLEPGYDGQNAGLAVGAGAGLDYHWTNDLSVGVAGRYLLFPGLDDAPRMLSVTLTAAYVWGF